MNEEHHKGEWCPYAERMGRQPTLCQEGYCNGCQIYLDYSDRVASHSEGVPVSDCPLGLKVCYPSCYWWQDGKCIFKKEAEMVENEITLSLTKSQLIVVAFFVGEFYRSWDKNKGLQYQCPERAEKATCPLPEKCSLRIIWIRPVQDYRRFGYRVPRNTDGWNIIYTYRVGIERIFSRLKGQRRLDTHCFRGQKKIQLHCTLAMLCLVAGALAKARSHQVEELRDCARRVP